MYNDLVIIFCFLKTLWHAHCFLSVNHRIMKDQIKVQSTSEKFQQEALFMGDHLQVQDNAASSSFKNTDHGKKVLASGLQKKTNPRLMIL